MSEAVPYLKKLESDLVSRLPQMSSFEEGTREFWSFWYGWKRILCAMPANYENYHNYRFGGKKKFKIFFVPMECEEDETSVRCYLASLADWMKTRDPTRVVEMRQFWLQYAQNVWKDKVKARLLSNQQPPRQPVQEKITIRNLKQRLDKAESALDDESYKRRKSAKKVYDLKRTQQ
ncbi:hypothetical protein AC1031_002989 [Aphanomyces cochlioides]|nr:hypothetical protein AC1031_002989 [Aphanomyces cochlioides]